MGAVPKNKVSRHRRGNRRRHLAIVPPVMVVCPQCGSLMRAHRACKECGTYRGRQVIEIVSEQSDDR